MSRQRDGFRSSRVHLGDLVEIKHGFAFQGRYFSDEGPYALLTPGNFEESGGFRRREKQKFYTGPVPANFVLKKGDLLVAMTEQGEGLLGSAAFIPSDGPYLHNQRLGLVSMRPEVQADLRYIYYLFNTPSVRAQIRASASGTKVRHTAPARLYAIEADVPDLGTQRRIASILGSYDDLIEVNRRRIAALEEMARRLFEEWFVHLRFPGHETEPVEDAPEGSLPKGWTRGIVGDLIAFDPATRLTRGVSKPFISMSALDTSGSFIGAFEWREGGSGARFQNHDTLLARITPCLENGKTGLVRDLPDDGVGFGSTEFIVMRGQRSGPAFTYLLARHEPFRAHARRSMSGATGRQRARVESVRTFGWALPPTPLLSDFEARSWPMLQLSGTLGRANAYLAATRDLLLPRLLSGELDVSAAERALESAA